MIGCLNLGLNTKKAFISHLGLPQMSDGHLRQAAIWNFYKVIKHHRHRCIILILHCIDAVIISMLEFVLIQQET